MKVREKTHQISNFASHVSLFSGTILVRIKADFERIEMISSTQATSGPVEEVLARDIHVHMPSEGRGELVFMNNVTNDEQ